jgi:hypothetical protein
LFANLEQDSVNYPHDLCGYMDYLWHTVKEQRLRPRDIQAKLNILGKWISRVELSSPKGIWRDYNG